MKKIIILIAILCSFGFCGSIIKIYNKTTGQVVKTFTNTDCDNNSLWILDGEIDLIPDKMAGVIVNEKHFKQFNVGCDDSKYDLRNIKDKKSIILGIYDSSLFAYTVEYIEQSLR